MSLLGLVLAGRRNEGRLRPAAPDVAWEALIPVAGRPLAAWVVAALRGVPGCARVALVGPDGVSPDALAVAPAGGLADNLQAGVAALGAAEGDELLVAAGDAPLLRPAALADFLAGCREAGADIGYAIVPRAACEAAFPHVRRTYVRLRDDVFTGGNCFYLRARAVGPVTDLVGRFYRARKNPLRLAALLGIGPLFGLATGRARIADLERVAAARFRLRARAVVSPDAGVGVDVDDPDDLALCRAHLRAGAR